MGPELQLIDGSWIILMSHAIMSAKADATKTVSVTYKDYSVSPAVNKTESYTVNDFDNCTKVTLVMTDGTTTYDITPKSWKVLQRYTHIWKFDYKEVKDIWN